MLRASLNAALCAAMTWAAAAASNVRSGSEFSWSANAGWLDWRAGGASGANFGRYILSGFIYSANLGWISTGNGAPRNGIAYQNEAGSDFGVNMDAQGNLSGLAYGANIGWIVFDGRGSPRVDLLTGKVSGAIYSANVGWIELSGTDYSLAVMGLDPGRDTDGDGIPDAYELGLSGSLSNLGQFSDADQDGQSDLEEYFAGTNPFDPADLLRIVEVAQGADFLAIKWPAKAAHDYFVEQSPSLGASAVWSTASTQTTKDNYGYMSARVDSSGNHRSFFRIRSRPAEIAAP